MFFRTSFTLLLLACLAGAFNSFPAFANVPSEYPSEPPFDNSEFCETYLTKPQLISGVESAELHRFARSKDLFGDESAYANAQLKSLKKILDQSIPDDPRPLLNLEDLIDQTLTSPKKISHQRKAMLMQIKNSIEYSKEKYVSYLNRELYSSSTERSYNAMVSLKSLVIGVSGKRDPMLKRAAVMILANALKEDIPLKSKEGIAEFLFLMAKKIKTDQADEIVPDVYNNLLKAYEAISQAVPYVLDVKIQSVLNRLNLLLEDMTKRGSLSAKVELEKRMQEHLDGRGLFTNKQAVQFLLSKIDPESENLSLSFEEEASAEEKWLDIPWKPSDDVSAVEFEEFNKPQKSLSEVLPHDPEIMHYLTDSGYFDAKLNKKARLFVGLEFLFFKYSVAENHPWGGPDGVNFRKKTLERFYQTQTASNELVQELFNAIVEDDPNTFAILLTNAKESGIKIDKIRARDGRSLLEVSESIDRERCSDVIRKVLGR